MPTSGLILSPPQIIPSRHRNSSTIDTNTLIEIHHDRSDVDLYYTLDGTKPDRLVTLASRKSTLEYRKPFYISRQLGLQGRVVIKAIAVSKDGLYESGMAMRTFTVRVVRPDHPHSIDDENKHLYLLQEERQLLMEKFHRENDYLQRISHENTQRFLNEPFSTEKLARSPYLNPSESPMDLPRCAFCLTPKSNDPYTRYCTECGLPWQQLTHQPPIVPTVRMCSRCDSAIPFNADACVVCETPALASTSAPLPPPVHILCPKCKSANPSNARTCAMCQSHLFPVTHPTQRASVSVPSDSTNRCAECQRENKAQARFCDWCGAARPAPPISIACTKCHAKNMSTAKFCHSCGCVMEVPLRLSDSRLSQDSNNPSKSMIVHTLTDPSVNPRWLSAQTMMTYDRRSTLMNKSEAATQTFGIYYPSAKDLDLVMTQNKKLLEKQEFPERPSRLTTSSPGKGYWKRQIDHVYTHLQAHAAERPEFRSLIGEPVMGPLLRARVDDRDDEVTIQVVFRKETRKAPPVHLDFDSDDEYKREKPQTTKPRTRPHSAHVPHSKNTLDQRLIELLEEESNRGKRKSSKQVDTADEVRRLLEKGADANACNEDGYTALQLAVRKYHHDCLRILIKDGKAKLDKRGPLGNTALHECCLLHSDGVEPLRILLKYGGDANWKNDRGETVIDLASKQQSPELLEVIRAVRDQEKAKEHRMSSPGSGYRYSGKA